jgi:hypothetical protein
MTHTCSTHEQYIQAVAEIAIARLPEIDQRKAKDIKLVYGAGPDGVRGVTYYNRWQKPGDDAPAVPFVEISAFNQSSAVQLAGTTIHELGHVIAGWSAGHGPEWKSACEALGLRRILAGGTDYKWAMFHNDIRAAIALLPQPVDGTPKGLGNTFAGLGLILPTFMGWAAGIGSRGGKSRGKGSGSRLHLFECECVPVVKVRAAREELHATCDCCNTGFRFIK